MQGMRDLAELARELAHSGELDNQLQLVCDRLCAVEGVLEMNNLHRYGITTLLLQTAILLNHGNRVSAGSAARASLRGVNREDGVPRAAVSIVRVQHACRWS